MGKFFGEPVTKWLSEEGEDISMMMIEPFMYQDDRGLNWYAPKGAIINGASIPRKLWSIMGSPFTGDYRNASIIHDVYCNSKERSFERTHQVFCEMMRDLGVNPIKRKLMGFAVKRFGPKWG